MLEHLDDVEADFLRFYRLNHKKVSRMNSVRFFRLATRLFAYEGAVMARFRALAEEQEQQDPTVRGDEDGPAVQVDSTRESLVAAGLGDLIDYASV